MHRTPLAPEDAARLHMSRPANPMVITVALVLERAVSYEKLVARLEERLVRHPRFRQSVIEPRFGVGMPRWEDDPDFDVRRHVHRVSLAAHGPRVLDDLVGELMSSRLGGQHPLWHMYLVDGVEPALVFTVHHALADGVALLSLLEEIADDGTHARVRGSRSEYDGGPFAAATQLARGVTAAVGFVLRPADPRTPLRGHIGPWKWVAFSSALQLDALTGTAHALGTTLLGVLLAALSGALRVELGLHGPVDGLTLHALLPISLHGRRAELGNHYGSVLVRIPVGISDREERVSRVLEEVRSLRSRSAAALAGVRLAAAAGMATAAIERLGVTFLSHKASVVVSNVRGPRRRLHIAGIGVRDILVWVPAPGDVALAITLMSYAGQVRITAVADAAVVGDPRRIVVEVERELASISALTSAP